MISFLEAANIPSQQFSHFKTNRIYEGKI